VMQLQSRRASNNIRWAGSTTCGEIGALGGRWPAARWRAGVLACTMVGDFVAKVAGATVEFERELAAEP
jgi:hypothetical protein